jgi:hypothetical protein
LTKIPTDAGRRFAGACIDSPSDAEVYETTLRDGDIIVVYVISRVALFYSLLANALPDRRVLR